MAHGLEVRVPMLDYEFVEWVATIAPTQKLSKREGKACLKRALRPFLSDEILYRDKMGFAVPISQWFRRELADEIREVISGNRLRDCGFFDNAYLDRLLKEHQSGAGEHSPVLWSLLMFDGFLGSQKA
jgi:asparagine synthase (glutamine-hydrolysing)